jgi:hypothetical protein
MTLSCQATSTPVSTSRRSDSHFGGCEAPHPAKLELSRAPRSEALGSRLEAQRAVSGHDAGRSARNRAGEELHVVRVVACLHWQRKRLNDAALPNDEIEHRIVFDRRVLLGETIRDAAVLRENLDSR